MISVEWKKEYELGVEEIDLQHHYFVDLINRLATELAHKVDSEYRRSLIDELNAYARFHFISEENMMIRARYPALAEHRQHHQQLLSELSNIELGMDMEDAAGDDVDQMLEFLVRWFLTHTAVEDRQLAMFLDRQGAN